ncbi:phosphotransferase [Bombiscardovia coagulans]|uniref:Aminoglycoside phosphotransferase domain-containing protein n=1 Tax=Bombiscardovia coagulans TaxID=686666 RepID=A0A261EVE4_9BIFI|nr:phosphotransferase [Bombiscardovia coagulans]OZG50844.1 hypothetical protein BOCO_0030 [Bombiscardovia coagulans]
MNLLLKNGKVSKEQSKFVFSNTVIAEVLKQFSWKKSDSSLIMTHGNNCLVLIRDGLVVRVGISANINPSVEKEIMDAARFANFPSPRILEIGALSSGIPYMVCEELPGEQPDQQFQWEEFGFKLSHFHSHATKSVFPDESFTLPERKNRIAFAREASIKYPQLTSQIDEFLDELTCKKNDMHSYVPVHGDLRLPNILSVRNRLGGVLDWSDTVPRM